MYITPALLTTANWDTLAAGARWSRAHSETLKDTHWIGGDPDKLQVYGWAAWHPEEGIVTLRNPSSSSQHYSLNLAKAFELRSSTTFTVHTPWTNTGRWQSGASQTIQSDKPLELQLAPFEVLTLEAAPPR
jgi:hypothetical protein